MSTKAGWAFVVAAAMVLSGAGRAEAVPSPPKEYTITVDGTALQPPDYWHIPGVTPEMASDPEMSGALRTMEKKAFQFRPGTYTYGTWTFSFQFTVTQDGHVEFAKTLDQCVEGRGTQTLKVNCRRTYPYGGQRDY